VFIPCQGVLKYLQRLLVMLTPCQGMLKYIQRPLVVVTPCYGPSILIKPYENA
jgi:hypothetical protein